MRWKDRRRSGNMQDRRMSSGGGGFRRPRIRLPRGGGSMGGGRMRMPRGGGAKLGGGGIVMLLVVGLVIFLLGGNPMALLGNLGGAGGLGLPGGLGGGGIQLPGGNSRPPSAKENELAEFMSVVLADTEDVWNSLLGDAEYVEPQMVLFRDGVRTGCGSASSAMGPFYCPADRTVYIDLGFFDQLERDFDAPGDFAQAYVIAHEVGHHVQNLMGTTDRVHRLKGRVGEAEYNDQSVRLELQADFFAGVWAHHAHKRWNILERGDVEEALTAASAIGDDRIMEKTLGRANPESFTHGTSEQRMRWFRLGLETGDIRRGDTFSIPNP